MYGMINKAIRTLVTREAGEEVWEQVLETSGIETLGKVKSKCCKKYKKAEHKRCKKCPCFDLLKKVA